MMMEYLLEAAARLRLLSTSWLPGVGVVAVQAVAVVLGVFVLVTWLFWVPRRTRLRWVMVGVVGLGVVQPESVVTGAIPFSAASHPLAVVAVVDSTLTGTA